MKKKILGALLVVGIAAGAAFNVNMNSDRNELSLLSLANVEALAGENEKDKKYRYDIQHHVECIVLVGGAYAKGKEIVCWSGNDHIECAKCTL